MCTYVLDNIRNSPGLWSVSLNTYGITISVFSCLFQAYCEVEVMKMYMPLCVREAGVIRWHLSEGAALKPGDRLATLELDDPSAVTMAEVWVVVE